MTTTEKIVWTKAQIAWIKRRLLRGRESDDVKGLCDLIDIYYRDLKFLQQQEHQENLAYNAAFEQAIFTTE